MEKLDKYISELEEDAKLDHVNLEEKTLLIPGVKAKWVTRRITHRRDYMKYQQLYQEAIEKVSESIKSSSDLALNKATLEKMAQSHETVKKINSAINEQLLYIEFCEEATKVVMSMSFDIKNKIAWSQMELA